MTPLGLCVRVPNHQEVEPFELEGLGGVVLLEKACNYRSVGFEVSITHARHVPPHPGLRGARD